MGSGLIYTGLIVLWSMYFIPRWLKRHEELSESRSVERFDRAMRILSRREPSPDRRYVVMPPRPAHPGTARPATRRGFRTTSSVTVRRRRVLAALLLTLVTALVLTPFTALAWWAPVLVIIGLLGFLVHCRLQARSRSQVSRAREAIGRRSTSRLLRFDLIERLMAVRRELAAERAAEDVRWGQVDAALRREEEAERRRASAAADGWTPVPVPLPTYVTKPVAPRAGGTIDLTRPGAWSAAQEQAGSGPAYDAAHGSVPASTYGSAYDSGPETAHETAHALPEQRPAGAGGPAGPMSALMDDAAEADDQLAAILHRRAVND